MKNYQNLIFLLTFILFSPLALYSQISINEDNSNPDASAMLDIKSTDKGVLIPRMTSAQRNMISNAAVGLLVFDTDTETFWFNDSNGWSELVSGGVSSSIVDADNDTKIQVEETADEDMIRFDIAGQETIVIGRNASNDGRLMFNPVNSLTTNVFIGNQQTGLNTTGEANVAVGPSALVMNTSGYSNNAFGYSTLANNTTGDFNVAINEAALNNNIDGINNIGIGPVALFRNTSGNNNIGLGRLSGFNNTTGSGNILMGYHAGRGTSNHAKNNNVMIGYESGSTNQGDANVFLGHQAGKNESDSNRLYIENTSSASPLLYGEFDNDLLRVNGTLNINNAFSLPTTDGTANQVLQTDGAGSLTWADAASGGVQTLIEDADSDTKIQVEESADEDKIRFDLGGSEMLLLNTTLTGRPRLEFTGTNLYIGKDAGALDNGSSNIALGNSALLINNNGSGNIGIGALAGAFNQDGDNNILIGLDAGGYSALGVAHSKNNNVMIGANAGTANTGDNNVFLGYFAGYAETGSHKLIIESQQSNTNPLIYGEFDNDLLRVNGTLNINNAFSFPTIDGAANQVLQTDGAGSLTWADATSGGVQTLIEDADSDTKIQVEESADEDVIRFDVAGAEKLSLTQTTTGRARLEFADNASSIYMGLGAGEKDAGSLPNIAIGENSLTENTSGVFNIGLGTDVLKSNTSGLGNTAIGGGNALQANTTGNNNIAIGNNSGYNSTTGDENVLIGNSAGLGNQEGNSNVLIGNSAGAGTSGQDTHNKNNNVMIGHGAGALNKGNGNVFLGYNAALSETGDNKLYIENSDSNSPLLYGEFDNDLLRVNGTLNVNNAFSFPTADGTANQVLQTDGAGSLTWKDAGSGVQTLIEDTDSDTKIQVEESADEDVIRFDIKGKELVVFSKNSNQDIQLQFPDLTGSSSIYIGDSSTGEFSTGEGNLGIGRTALANTTGFGNIAVGLSALHNTTTGSFNHAFGQNALTSNTTGSTNVAFGRQALNHNTSGESNTAVGNYAGFSNTGGSRNTFIGCDAGYGISQSGRSNNVMLGYKAGYLTQGSNNVMLGFNAGRNEMGSNKLYIENSDSASPLLYGEFDNDLLRVNGTLNINNAFSFPTTDGTANQVLQTDGAGNTSWTTVANTDTNDQTIDVLNLDGNTLEISLEDDGEPTQTVDLSGVTPNTVQSSDGFVKIQVEESPNDNRIRFDIGIEESYRMESNRFLMNPGLDTNFDLEITGTSATNKIKNRLPLNVGNPPDSDYKMEFEIKGSKALELRGDKAVQVSGEYTLPTDKGNANEVLVTDGNGNTSWENVGVPSGGNADEVLVTDGNGNTSWQNVGVPIGTIQMWPTATPPTGWIICDGSTFNSSTYPDLFAVLGTTTLPNFNGRMPLGVGQSNENGATNHTLNQTGGEETHILGIDAMPAHSHDVTVTYRQGSEQGSGNNYSDLGGGSSSSTTFTSSTEGGGQAHNNMPPFYTINFIIRAE